MRQDASYFDDPKHSTGALTTRLASDAPNVQAVRDAHHFQMDIFAQNM